MLATKEFLSEVSACGEPKLQRDRLLMILACYRSACAGGPRAHHTARANEALYDAARKTHLQTSSWVLLAQLDWSNREYFMCQHA